MGNNMDYDVPRHYHDLTELLKPSRVVEERLTAQQVNALRGKSPLEMITQNTGITPIDIDGKVDKTTYWTTEKFINEIVKSDKITYVHWRWEGVGNNKIGDEFLKRLIKEFPEIDRFIVIELSRYKRNEWKQLVEIPGYYNPEEGPIKGGPKGSLFKDGNEFRIRGPPSHDFPYEQIRDDIRGWLSKFYTTTSPQKSR